MRTRWLTLPAALFPLFLASCGNTTPGGSTTGTGPFDSSGNYVESWADSPSKWKKGSRGGTDAPAEQAEIVALQAPLMGNRASTPVTPVIQTPIVRPPTAVASVTPRQRPTVSRSDDEDSPRSSKGKSTSTTQNSSKTKGKTAIAANSTKAKSATSRGAKTTGKPKPVAVKVKPKATSNRYAVRQGDSLYAIAKRYGTTASAIQKANGMSGSVIRPGQSLTIPR